MEQTIVFKIMSFFDNVDDMLNNFVDRMELTPVQVGNNLFVSGFRRSPSNNTSIDVHLKEIRKIKLDNINASITDEGGWYMMEPDGEIWVDSHVLSDALLKTVLAKFMENFGKLNTLHIMLSKWKDEGDDYFHVEVSLFENKRVACKEALAIRKKHKNVTNKFEMYSSEGDLIESITQENKEPSDFELITCDTSKLSITPT